MIPALYGLLSGKRSAWRSLEGNDYIRARIYTDIHPFVWVGLTVMADGRWQVVEHRIRESWLPAEARVRSRGRLSAGGPGQMWAWPAGQLLQDAGLDPTVPDPADDE